ncbi:MAG: hypothetical protein A2178_02765 [Planctomycetes bacterium GWC2_49_10]|nr:MAG: hypothetical protein A2178_02765 [Planctomycetes bacterium GWC2_49_10]
MYIQTQFSIFMVNKPGVLARMLSEMARAKVNIIAMTMMDSVENGVMRLVAVNYAKAKEVLTSVNMPFNESEVLCVNLPNEPGAFAEVVEKLARNHINISYAYVTAGARGGRTTGVLKVADVKKAIKILQSNATEHDKPAVKKRVHSPRR